MGDWDSDNADYHDHYNSGQAPGPGASEAAHRGYQDHVAWDADMAKIASGVNYMPKTEPPPPTPIYYDTPRYNPPPRQTPQPAQRYVAPAAAPIHHATPTYAPQRVHYAPSPTVVSNPTPYIPPPPTLGDRIVNLALEVGEKGVIGTAILAATAVGGTVVLGIASLFSENARSMFMAGANVVVPAVFGAVKFAIVDVAVPAVYYTACYGYEAVATSINNIDLLAATAVAGGASLLTAMVIDDSTTLFTKTRNVVAGFVVAGVAITSAVYATATHARKLGYEIGLPHYTDTGAAISAWGRQLRISSRPTSYSAPPATAQQQRRPLTQTVTPPAPPAQPAPPHRTEEEIRSIVRYLRSGGKLTESQHREMWDKGIRFRMEHGKPHTMEAVVPPGYFPQEAQRQPLPQRSGTALSADPRLLNRTPPPVRPTYQPPPQRSGTALSADPRLLGRAP